MLLRIALAIAILAGIAATVLNVVTVKQKVTVVMNDRDQNAKDRDTAQASLAKTKSDLVKTNEALVTRTRELATARTERASALTEADNQRKEATRLKDQLDKTTTEKVEAQRDLAAWKTLGYSTDQIKVLIADLTRSKKDLAAFTNRVDDLTHELASVQNRLDQLIGVVKEVAEPDLVARVIEVDPKFNFIVLDVGQSKGMLENGEMLINRQGKLVAKVRIRTVERERCIANVLPGWEIGQVAEGDLAVAKLPKL